MIPRLLVRLLCVCALSALLIPPLLFGGIGPFPTLLIQSLAIAGAFLLVALWSLGRPVLHRRHPVVVAIVWLVPFALFSFAQARLGPTVLRRLPGSLAPFATYDYAVQLCVYAALFLLFYAYLENRFRLRLALTLLAVEITLLAAAGFFHQEADFRRADMLFGMIRMPRSSYYSSFTNPNHFGAYLAASLPLFAAACTYFMKSRPKGEKPGVEAVEKLFFLLLIPLTALSCLAADARMALFWGLALLAIFAAANFLKPVWIGLSMAAGVSAVAVFMAKVPSLALERLSKDLASRLEITRDCLPILQDFPYGTGLGTSRFILAFYQKTSPENWVLGHPYNHFLQLLFEVGWIGAALFALPVAGFLAWGLSRSQRSASRWDRIFGLAAFVPIAGYTLPAFFDNYISTPAIAILLLFGAALLARSADGSFDPERRRPPRPRPQSGPLAVTLALAACGTALLLVGSDYEVRAASTALSKDAVRLTGAVRLRPDDAIAWTELAHWHYNEASRLRGDRKEYRSDAERAAAAYRKGIQAAPTWPRGWMGLARTEFMLGRNRLGSRHLEIGVNLSPWHRDRILYLIHTQLKLAEGERSKKRKKRFLETAEKFARIGLRLSRPLSPIDCFYVDNDVKNQLTPKQQRRIASFLSDLYRRGAEPKAT